MQTVMTSMATRMTADKLITDILAEIAQVIAANISMQTNPDRELGHNQVLFHVFPRWLPRNIGANPTPEEGKIWCTILRRCYSKASKGSLHGMGRTLLACLDHVDQQSVDWRQQYEALLNEGESRAEVVDPYYEPPLRKGAVAVKAVVSKRGREEEEAGGPKDGGKRPRQAGTAHDEVTAPVEAGPSGSGWRPDVAGEEQQLRDMRRMVHDLERMRREQRGRADKELHDLSLQVASLDEERSLLREVRNSRKERTEAWERVRPFYPVGKANATSVRELWRKLVEEGGVPEFAVRQQTRTERVWSEEQLRSLYKSGDYCKDMLLEKVLEDLFRPSK